MKNLIFFIGICVLYSQSVIAQNGERTELKVCADPHNLPYSNKAEEGFENKIAELFAAELRLPLKYEWFPQRMGFIRNTLKSESSGEGYKCDLVIGVPDRFELAATTKPYYASTYAFVYAKGRGMDGLQVPGNIVKLPKAKLEKIRIGVFDRGPAQLWVFKYDLFGNAVPYVAQSGAVGINPINVLDDIAANKIDATIIWGPIAGYYAKNTKKVELVVLPLQVGDDNPEMKFNYNMSMAVRFGEREWKQQINQLIDKKQNEIDQILDSYGLPSIPITVTQITDDD
ncbi:MAG: quinoprotein dehydrogenase-associated putative ABC transporter substrate-binding protein [Gammaproteobacteria bacterium]|jgi:mxaJ protein|nr:quinoprotein dehydrogenase-associated putative ABC transporter substrate-binding protein [Gammaproteobacteria bacterium]